MLRCGVTAYKGEGRAPNPLHGCGGAGVLVPAKAVLWGGAGAGGAVRCQRKPSIGTLYCGYAEDVARASGTR